MGRVKILCSIVDPLNAGMLLVRAGRKRLLVCRSKRLPLIDLRAGPETETRFTNQGPPFPCWLPLMIGDIAQWTFQGPSGHLHWVLLTKQRHVLCVFCKEGGFYRHKAMECNAGPKQRGCPPSYPSDFVEFQHPPQPK